MDLKILVIDKECKDPATELRFAVASERASGGELLRVDFPVLSEDKDTKRIMSLAKKTLNLMKKEKLIQFFVNQKNLSDSSTEVEFLKNKYSDLLERDANTDSAVNVIFIKI